MTPTEIHRADRRELGGLDVRPNHVGRAAPGGVAGEDVSSEQFDYPAEVLRALLEEEIAGRDAATRRR